MSESSTGKQEDIPREEGMKTRESTVPVEISDLELLYPSGNSNSIYTGVPESKLIAAEIADPKCSLCKYIIQEVNEIFEQHNSSCPDPREYCITHLLEAMITSLVWRLSKQ